mgnify:CR=1 FL=1
MTHAQREVLAYLVETLNAADIPFQISGGLAAICHGATRPLFDIDLDIRACDATKVRALYSAHVQLDWHRCAGPDEIFELWLMTLSIQGVPVDISQSEDSYVFDSARRRVPLSDTLDAEFLTIDGLLLPVQRKQALLAYKRIAARDTDLLDIAELITQRPR